MSRRWYIFLAVLSLLVQGCGSSGYGKRTKQKAEEIETVWIKNLSLMDCREKNEDGKIGIRYIRDSVTVVIMRGKSGIEGGRIYIYRDSLFIFNRMKKKYLAEKIDDAGNYVMNGKEVQWIRKNTQKKYFEYTMMKKGKIKIYVKEYHKINEHAYIPATMIVKVRWEGKDYCILLKGGKVQTNVKVNTGRIEPSNRYQRTHSIQDVL